MATVTWTGASGGDWDTPKNWSSNPALPGSADSVSIDTSASATITHSMAEIDGIGSLTTAATDTLDISSGSLTDGGASTLAGGVTVTGVGMFTLNEATSFSAGLYQTGGLLGGTGGVTITGATTCNDAMNAGSGITDTQGNVTLGKSGGTGIALALDGGRTWQNDGTATWLSGDVVMGYNRFGSSVGGGYLNNTGLLDDEFNGDIPVNAGSAAFNDTGTLEKTGGSGTTVIAPPVSNIGTVLANASARPQGGDRRSHVLEAQAGLIDQLLAETPDQTLMELRDALAGRGVRTTYTSLWRFFRRHGVTRKKRPPTPRSRNAPTS